MRVLVPGGNGFVGRHVTTLLKQAGHDVIPMSRHDGLDMTDLKSTRDAFARIRPDVIVNCAAHVGSLHYVSEFAATVFDENMRIILNLFRASLEACPKAKIVNPISNCSYPGEAQIHSEPKWWDGPVHRSVWSYGNPRRMMAVASDCYAMQHHLKIVNFLVANAYGPGDYTDPNKTHALNGLIIRMLKAKQAQEPSFEIWGTGKPEREWVFVKDLARMLAYAVDHVDEQVAPINLAQHKAYSIQETAEIIQKAIDYPGQLVFNTKYQDGAMRKILDDRLFRQKYPDFRFTDMRDGIKETVAYYLETLELEVHS